MYLQGNMHFCGDGSADFPQRASKKEQHVAKKDLFRKYFCGKLLKQTVAWYS
jgi:hypothetical protein